LPACAVEAIQVDVCKAMVERTWRGMLSAISQLLQRSAREEIVLQLLKVGWQRSSGVCVAVAERRLHVWCQRLDC
jgi:predicted ABC-class ATPase